MYRLANRIRKLDEDEVDFLKQLHEENLEKQKALKIKEQEELEKFRADVESRVEDEMVPIAKPKLSTKKRTRDIQKEILTNGIVLKKRNVDSSSPIVTGKTDSATPVTSLVSAYPSSEED
jgi:hypothetical protein